MRLAILGATSQIAKDLVRSLAAQSSHELVLYARHPEVVAQWLQRVGLDGRFTCADFPAFSLKEHFDVIINFVGVGDPANAVSMGSAIFDITAKYDAMALNYVTIKTECRYLFLSSGAVYCSSFEEPVNDNSKATIEINNLKPQDWYAVAKLHAECRHRSFAHLPIVDIRVFNYFSHTQNMGSRFLMTDILRSLRDGSVVQTSPVNIFRDYITPFDFHRLIEVVLGAEPINISVDCYSRAPVDKLTLLHMIRNNYGLNYQFIDDYKGFNATGAKINYYSLRRIPEFLDYQPVRTSMEGILHELNMFFDSNSIHHIEG